MKKDVKKQIWIQIKGENIRVEKKKIKNLYLRISPADGAIRISAPERMSIKQIENFVLDKWDWIQTTRERLDRVREEKSASQLTEDEKQAQKEACKKKLLEVLPQVIRKCERITGLHALEWKLRDMKTRWGSCNIQKKRIWLNIQLAAYPRECLEYVVTHELVHLLVPGHGKEFWAYMDRFFPEWRRVRKELNGR
ncbi:MAG TPA: M48 family metallopeptidase [Candidatus Blautia avicola]|uniref:M48 family metallopeptidase n=1 Tax=Candidatus Blautia avicola TaxID=2838483 RepID=A0A9D2TYD8_9FIRM|nr:M48 family metallopeptidase [Candidatus Blautia avicola]